MPKTKTSARKGSKGDGPSYPPNSFDRIIGIDNGVSGGWCVLKGDGEMVGCGRMPTVERTMSSGRKRKEVDAIALFTTLKFLTESRAGTLGAIEFAHAMPSQGVSSTFTFGQSYGAAKSIVSLLCGAVSVVDPKVWQAKALPRTGDSKTESLAAAYGLYPEQAKRIGKNHGISDAILIARHFVRQ